MSVRMDIEKVITMIVDYHLPKTDFQKVKFDNNDNSITRKGLLFNLKIRTEVWNDKKQNFEYYCKSFLIAFCGHVSVFVKEIDSNDSYFEHIGKDKDYNDWINTSNHGSCWRTDGLHFIFDNYIKMCERVYPDKKPVECDVYAEFGFINNYPKFVNIKIVNDNENGYRYKIKEITELMK